MDGVRVSSRGRNTRRVVVGGEGAGWAPCLCRLVDR